MQLFLYAVGKTSLAKTNRLRKAQEIEHLPRSQMNNVIVPSLPKVD